MQYKGVHRPLPEIARELGVDGVLEGSISRNGDNVHMTIQLIRATDDTHVWAESYDRAANDVVSLPKEASQAIANKLNRAVVQAGPARYVSPEAHDAYLRGRYLWFSDHTVQAGPYFKRATELQPDYALGWSGLALYYGASAVKGELSPAESLAQSEIATGKAMELDDSLAEAHLAAAGTAMATHWDLARADTETLKAIELDPKFAEAYHLRAKILAAQNRHAEAIETQRKGTEIDPFTRPWALALAFMEARQFDAALKDANQRLVANPNNSILVGLMSRIYERNGMEKESVESLVKYWTLEGRGVEVTRAREAFAARGFKGVLQWKLEIAKKRAEKSYVSPVDVARLYALMGDSEKALAQLQEAYRQRATALLWMQDDPAFDGLHKDERYRAIVRGVGLPPQY
jgi:tetratricopeptide (TPR) repeat protein